MLSSYLPYPRAGRGGAVRVWNLLRALSSRFSVTLLSFAFPGEETRAKDIAPLCRRLEIVSTDHLRPVLPDGFFKRLIHLFWPLEPDDALKRLSPVFAEKLGECLAGERFDAALVEFPEMAPWSRRLPASLPKFLDTHEVRSEIHKRAFLAERRPLLKLYFLSQWVKTRGSERSYLRDFDGLFTVSERDRARFQNRGGGKPVVCVPTGVPLRDFAYVPPPGRRGNLLACLGNYRNPPNVEGLLWFAREVFPALRRDRPALEWLILGLEPPPELRALGRQPGVTVTGYLPDPFERIAEARVFLAPIFSGGGIKGKIVEAMALGTPVVATSRANEGVGAEAEEEILLADDAKSFARQVVRLLSDDGLAERLSRRGRALVESRFNWDDNVRPLLELLERGKRA